MCLAAMETIPKPDQWTLFDLGTGSGILVIYGAKLGAKRIIGTDIDKEALGWAEKNIGLNHLDRPIEISARPIEEWEGPFFMVTANLILRAISELLPHIVRVLEPSGWAILSGLLHEQVNQVIGDMKKTSLGVNDIIHQEEWSCIVAQKK